MEIVIGGEYEHFKGKHYRVIAIADDSETQEDMVVYERLYDQGGWCVRPLKMFMEDVTRDGKTMQRFRLIHD